MNPEVDSRLKVVYGKAMDVLKEHQKALLKYNDETCLSKAMRPVIAVKVNSRSNLRKRGCCKYMGNMCIIEISEYMLSFDEDEILTTMIHELLHTFRDSHDHSGSWLWRANYLKEQTGLNIQRTRTIAGEYEVRQKIQEESALKPWMNTYKCTGCGKKVVKSKNSKFAQYVEHYRCGNCKGEFERIW